VPHATQAARHIARRGVPSRVLLPPPEAAPITAATPARGASQPLGRNIR